MKSLNKVLCAILCLALVLSLAACGKSAADETASGAQSDAADAPADASPAQPARSETPVPTPAPTLDTSAVFTVDAVSTERAAILPERAYIRSMVRLSTGLALLWEDGEDYALGIAPYSVDDEGKPSVEEPAPVELALPYDDGICYGLAPAGGDGFVLLAGNGRDTGSTELTATLYDAQGAVQGGMTIPDWRLMTVDSFCVSDSARLVISAGNTAMVYDWGAAQGSELPLGLDDVYRLTGINGGVMISGRKNWEGPRWIFVDEGGTLQDIDLYALVPENDAELIYVPGDASDNPPCQGFNGEYILNTGACLYEVEPGQMTSKLFAWRGAAQDTVGDSCLLAEKSLACLVDGKLTLAYEHAVEKRESGRVRVGVVEIGVGGSIARSLADVNGADTPYTAEFTSYVSDEAGLARFQADLIKGEFDLVLFHDEVNTFNANFEDLYPYLDADAELTRDSFLPGLLEGSSIKGQLKQLWNSATICTMVAPAGLVGDGGGLTVADCKQIVRESGKVQSVLDNRFGDEGQLRYDTLQNTASMAVAAFIDRDSGTCSFDSAEFIELLTLCGELKANPESDGKDFLLYTESTSSANGMTWREEQLGTACVPVGWPDGGEGIHYYSLPNDLKVCYTMAIPANSANKGGAWGIIKYILSEPQQRKFTIPDESGYTRSGMPVIYSVVESYNRQNFSAEQCEQFFDLIERTHSTLAYNDESLRRIIMEVGQRYLAGDITAADAARQIQSRISIYMAEQYG